MNRGMTEPWLDLEQVSGCDNIAHVEAHEQIGSTNSRGIELASDPAAPLPALILAQRQSGGRGRGANRWWSGEGSLTFSLVIAPDARQLPLERWGMLSLATGLAVADALWAQAPNTLFGLKWPNDVYCNGRKACGILLESAGAGRSRLVVGIGINVNSSFSAAPEELRRTATSLYEETRVRHDMTRTLLAVVANFQSRQRQLCDSPTAMLSDWRAQCMLTGRQVELAIGGERVSGLCLGIDDDGALLLDTPAGVRRLITATVTRWS